MRRTRAWVGAVACGAAVVLAGCNGTTSRPAAVPVKPDGQTSAGTPKAKVAKPAQSDPAAEAVIDKLLKAHTGGKPELIEPLKSHTLLRKGQFIIGEEPHELVWRVQAVWPGQYRVEMEWPARGGVRDVMVQNGAEGWKLMRTQGAVQPGPFTAAEYPPMATDAFAEWTAVLVPLLDAKARVAAVPPGGAAGTVWVWVADKPAVMLTIDEKSGLLARVDYEVPEFGGAIAASLALSEHKPTNGVLLPTKVDYNRNNRPTARWASSEVEFPKAVPPEAFTKP